MKKKKIQSISKGKHLKLSKAMRRAARIYALVALFLSFAYIEVGVFLEPNTFLEKWTNVYARAASNLSLGQKIYGPVQEPGVQTSKGCDDEEAYIYLEWEEDESAISFNVERDGQVVRKNTQLNEYRDNSVDDDEKYTYVVVANNPYSSVSSDSVSIRSKDCGSDEDEEDDDDDPYIAIQTINSIERSFYKGDIQVASTQPSFEGMTNASRSTVYIYVSNDPSITATVITRSNGYWEWTSPVALTEGVHTITVLVVSREGIYSEPDIVTFRVDTQGEGIPDSFYYPDDGSIGDTDLSFIDVQKYFKHSITANVLNKDKRMIAGSDLDFSIFFKDTLENVSVDRTPQFIIYDDEGVERYRLSHSIESLRDGVLSKQISLPAYLEPGHYSVQAIISGDRYVMSAQDSFIIEEAPFIHLGGGVMLTRSDVVDNLGLIVLVFLSGLLIFLLLILLEYFLYILARSNIEGKDLKFTKHF